MNTCRLRGREVWVKPSEPQDRSLLIWGGVAGVVMTVVYGIGQSLPGAGVELGAGGAMQVFFWTAVAFGPLGVINSYAIYRLLAWERQGAMNRLALLMSLLAYGIVTVMLLVQGSVGYFAAEADADLMRMLRGVDLGIDLAWDVFMGTSLMLTAGVMWRHSRFRMWWAIPAGILGLLLIVLNGITAPNPPNSASLIDVGPLTAIYGTLLSVFLVRAGAKLPRSVTRRQDHPARMPERWRS